MNLQTYNFSQSAELNLWNNGILSIVRSLINTIKVNIHSLTEGKFNLVEHISINWERTIDFEYNEDDIQLMDNSFLYDENQINEILVEFQRQWKIVYSIKKLMRIIQ